MRSISGGGPLRRQAPTPTRRARSAARVDLPTEGEVKVRASFARSAFRARTIISILRIMFRPRRMRACVFARRARRCAE